MDVTLSHPVVFSVLVTDRDIREYAKCLSGFSAKNFSKNSHIYAVDYCKSREVNHSSRAPYMLRLQIQIDFPKNVELLVDAPSGSYKFRPVSGLNDKRRCFVRDIGMRLWFIEIIGISFK